MSEPVKRNTFLPLRDILTEAAERCQAAEAHLASGPEKQPQSQAWKEIARAEHELADLLLEFARGGPANLLDTRFQYLPGGFSFPKPCSAEQAVEILVTGNHELTEMLRELRDNMVPQELEEPLDQLLRQVESKSQSISMISTTMQDV